MEAQNASIMINTIMIIRRNISMKDEEGNWTSLAKKLVWNKAPSRDTIHPEYGNMYDRMLYFI